MLGPELCEPLPELELPDDDDDVVVELPPPEFWFSLPVAELPFSDSIFEPLFVPVPLLGLLVVCVPELELPPELDVFPEPPDDVEEPELPVFPPELELFEELLPEFEPAPGLVVEPELEFPVAPEFVDPPPEPEDGVVTVEHPPPYSWLSGPRYSADRGSRFEQIEIPATRDVKIFLFLLLIIILPKIRINVQDLCLAHIQRRKNPCPKK